MLLDSYAAGKPLSKAESVSINALEKVANQDMGVFDRQKAVIDSLKESLRADKDGSLAGNWDQTSKQEKHLSWRLAAKESLIPL